MKNIAITETMFRIWSPLFHRNIKFKQLSLFTIVLDELPCEAKAYNVKCLPIFVKFMHQINTGRLYFVTLSGKLSDSLHSFSPFGEFCLVCWFSCSTRIQSRLLVINPLVYQLYKQSTNHVIILLHPFSSSLRYTNPSDCFRTPLPPQNLTFEQISCFNASLDAY